MKKYISAVFSVLLIFILSFNTYAVKNYGRRLEIEQGRSSIIMNTGDKIRLHVRSPLTGLPVYKGLHFCSGNFLVAAVNRSGIVRAGMCGKTYITVTDDKGRTDSILIIVERGGKTGLWGFVIIAAVAFAAVFLIFRISRGHRITPRATMLRGDPEKNKTGKHSLPVRFQKALCKLIQL